MKEPITHLDVSNSLQLITTLMKQQRNLAFTNRHVFSAHQLYINFSIATLLKSQKALTEEQRTVESNPLCDTLFFQGITTSQSQVLKYTAIRKLQQAPAKLCGVPVVITSRLLTLFINQILI